jgi:hypothetical protein
MSTVALLSPVLSMTFSVGLTPPLFHDSSSRSDAARLDFVNHWESFTDHHQVPGIDVLTVEAAGMRTGRQGADDHAVTTRSVADL